MIEFFRDILDGPIYIVVTILSIIFIMAIIGFLMERKKLEKDVKKNVAIIDTPIIDTSQAVTPITPVSVQTVAEVTPTSIEPTPISNLNQEENSSLEVKTPVIVFEDPDQKKE